MNNTNIDNMVNKIYNSPPIYKHGKNLFTSLAFIYETTKKALTELKEKNDLPENMYPNDFFKVDNKEYRIYFSLANESLFTSLLTYIVYNPHVKIIYEVDSYDKMILSIKFKNNKKFYKFIDDILKYTSLAGV